MSIGVALAGFAFLAAAAHPRGVRQLMGTPEEHLVKFHEYMSFAQNADLPRRIRIGFIERAWAEAEWTSVPASDTNELVRLQSRIDDTSSDIAPIELMQRQDLFKTTSPAHMMVMPAKGKSKKKVREQCDDGTSALHDRRHPPSGWTFLYPKKGGWTFVSQGDGWYRATSSSGQVLVGTGNSVIGSVHGYCMDFYLAMKLGNPGHVFNTSNPPAGWRL